MSIGRPPKNEPMGAEAVQAMEARRKKTKLYKGRADTVEVNDSMVAEIVRNAAANMRKSGEAGQRVSLADFQSLDKAAADYMECCAAVGSIPTVGGYAASIGYTRSAIYERARTHGEFRRWLEELSDTLGDVLAEGAMRGALSPVPVIFVLKSKYQWRDSVALEISRPDAGPLGEAADPAEIARKYQYLPED